MQEHSRISAEPGQQQNLAAERVLNIVLDDHLFDVLVGDTE
jgi:hypothetical protein